MSEKPTKNSEEPRFGDAMAELEAILRRIEGEEVDIDVLASELKRAAQLLDVCRDKIRKAEVEVSQIVQDLQGEDSDPRPEGAGTDDEESGEGELPF